MFRDEHGAGIEGADKVWGDSWTWVGLNVPTECRVAKRKMNWQVPWAWRWNHVSRREFVQIGECLCWGEVGLGTSTVMNRRTNGKEGEMGRHRGIMKRSWWGIQTHTDERIFKCKLCNATFTNSWYIYIYIGIQAFKLILIIVSKWFLLMNRDSRLLVCVEDKYLSYVPVGHLFF